MHSRIAPAHLKRAWVFGSSVKKSFATSRDVDVLIEAKPGLSLMEAAGLKIDLEEEFGRRVDIVSRKYLHPALRAEIESTKVLIYVRESRVAYRIVKKKRKV